MARRRTISGTLEEWSASAFQHALKQFDAAAKRLRLSDNRIAMIKEPQECLKRAGECVRLAETESDPELRAYLIKLGSSWAQAAREMDEDKSRDA